MKKIIVLFFLSFKIITASAQSMSAGQVDIFTGIDLNYRDIYLNGRIYDILLNLTPGIKWNMGKEWQIATQALIPVYNDYGDRYKKIRLNMAVLSKEIHSGSNCSFKISGGLFGLERYGLDLKSFFVINEWLAFEAQAGVTGYCSMAIDFEASTPERVTFLGGADVYLNRWNTQLRIRGGRFLYKDYGAIGEVMRHFKHCSVGLYAEHSNLEGNNGGFKIVMMIPPYKRKRHKVNFRPASNFRYIYNIQADAYANRMYMTDPEENEREGWFEF